MSTFEEMTKKELEAYGREMGIELDRRFSKSDLIAELEAFEMFDEPAVIDEITVDIETELDEIDALDHPLFGDVARVDEVGFRVDTDLPHGGPENDPLIQDTIDIPIPAPIIDEVDPAIAEQEQKDRARALQNINEDAVQAEARTIASRLGLEEAQTEYDMLKAHSETLRAAYNVAVEDL